LVFVLGLTDLVPFIRYGLKEPVYFKNSSGELTLPENVLSQSPETYKSDVKVLGAEVSEDRSKLILTTSKGTLPINVLEHVTIRIKVVESRAHLASIRVELVHFGLDPRFRAAAKAFSSDPNAVNAERISVKSEVLKAFSDVVRDLQLSSFRLTRLIIYNGMNSESTDFASRIDSLFTKLGEFGGVVWKI